jgi:regulatory protein spx
MLTLFFSPSCTSCRKAKAWLEMHQISFERRNIFSKPLQPEELKALLRLTDEGTEEIISRRLKVFQKLDIDFDDLPLPKLLELVQQNPSLLRRPMITDGKRLLIGFNEEEIRMFLPRSFKKAAILDARLRSGL